MIELTVDSEEKEKKKKKKKKKKKVACKPIGSILAPIHGLSIPRVRIAQSGMNRLALHLMIRPSSGWNTANCAQNARTNMSCSFRG